MDLTPQQRATLIATTNEGQEIVLQQILSLYFDADRFTPADSLECRFLDPLKGNQKIATLRLLVEGEQLFDGNVDVQTRTIGQNGTYGGLVCRSKIAAMLDNEVKPYWYYNLSSSQLFKSHALPYGAEAAEFPFPTTIPQILAKKGVSHWAFMEQFCKMAYQKRLYVHRGNVMTCEPFQETLHRFSNADRSAIPFLEAKISDDRYHMISKLYIKTAKEEYGGAYKYVVNNKMAQHLGVLRERYYHPDTASQDHALISGRALIEDQQLDYFEISLTLAGLLPIQVGDSASFYDGAGWYQNLYVSQIRQSIDSTGMITKLKLWNKRAVASA